MCIVPISGTTEYGGLLRSDGWMTALKPTWSICPEGWHLVGGDIRSCGARGHHGATGLNEDGKANKATRCHSPLS
jgi:hypothetical protein